MAAVPNHRHEEITDSFKISLIRANILFRATSFAERLHLRLAVIHGEPKGEMDEDGRNSPPPVKLDEDPLGTAAATGASMGVGPQAEGHVTVNLLSVVPKEKPPLNVVGDVHARIAIIVVSQHFRTSVKRTLQQGMTSL